ncbi:hypothetical protein L202_06684 [Cryptococcus amylolentus CBS 6039]|uniref:Uncharacterized protein n=1 Tax=Cryptococcus amylolentus CBS 6039 TaxID=1295533 RepID=A0A1E3HGT7_9TREE|nr:hypothetical protein L202_06684 [Cryptococcus amylolentus CBS 6039]ODN75557.1 hypothetical protein L202_06684 [Cryptococcus amylolentus CBS 6039]
MQAYNEACKKALEEFDEEKRLDLEETLELLEGYDDPKDRERIKQVAEEHIAEDRAELLESLEQGRLHILRTEESWKDMVMWR